MNTLRISEPVIGTAEIGAVQERLADGELTQNGGNSVAQFEAALAEFIGAQPGTVVACSSGTAALHLALLSVGLQATDFVLVPSLTYVATAAAVRYCGAIPVFVDVDPYTWTITAETVRAALVALPEHQRHRVRGIVPVHLYGVPADLPALNALAVKEELWIVDDAAQALGSSLNGARMGAHVAPSATSFSFYANKLITTGGEGGAAVCRDPSLARMLRGQGQSFERRYWHVILGYNYRMTATAAAFGTAQLKQAEDFIAIRRSIADVYRRNLTGYVQQYPPLHAECVDWLFTVLVPTYTDRDLVMDILAKQGIETRPAFPPVSTMPPYLYSPGGSDSALPVSRDIAARGISLPTHCRMLVSDAERVAEAFRNAVIGQRVGKGA